MKFSAIINWMKKVGRSVISVRVFLRIRPFCCDLRRTRAVFRELVSMFTILGKNRYPKDEYHD